MSGAVYIANQTAVFEFGGRRVIVKKNKTTVREGHAILKEFPGLFEPLHVDYEVAEKPPEPAPAPAPPAPAPEPTPVQAEEATADPERPRRRGRPPLPRDEFGNIVRPESEEGKEES